MHVTIEVQRNHFVHNALHTHELLHEGSCALACANILRSVSLIQLEAGALWLTETSFIALG